MIHTSLSRFVQALVQSLLPALVVNLVEATAARAADLSEVRLDWATYNPVSIVPKDQGLLEKALAPNRITVRWASSGTVESGCRPSPAASSPS